MKASYTIIFFMIIKCEAIYSSAHEWQWRAFTRSLIQWQRIISLRNMPHVFAPRCEDASYNRVGIPLFRFIAFSSLNSSDSRSEEFNDEKLMMRCKLSEPSLKKWWNDPVYTIIFLMIRAVIKKMMQWSLN